MSTKEITQTVNVCDICGVVCKPYHEDDNGLEYCYRCYNELFVECSFCGRSVNHGDIVYLENSDDLPCCKECAIELTERMITKFGVSFIPVPEDLHILKCSKCNQLYLDDLHVDIKLKCFNCK